LDSDEARLNIENKSSVTLWLPSWLRDCQE
jgi:hypothetical protein